MSGIVSVTAAPVVSTIASKDKGSFGNKVDCAKDHTVNNLKYGAAGAATLAAGGAAAAITHRVPSSFGTKINDSLNSVLTKLAKKMEVPMCGEAINKISNKFINTSEPTKLLNPKVLPPSIKGGKVGRFIHRNLNNLTKVSGKNKVLGAIALATLATLSLVKSKHDFKAGQIDQKYTDRAKAQEVAK